MEKYELQKLRDLPIESVAGRLGLQVTRHKCLCPFHDDHSPSMSFKVSKNTYRCFVCGAHGGTIDLVMRYLNKDFLEACRWLADEFDVIMDNVKIKQCNNVKIKQCNNEKNKQCNNVKIENGGADGHHPQSSDFQSSIFNIQSSNIQSSNLQSSTFNIQSFERFFERPWLSEEARRFLYEERRIDPRVVRWCRLTSWRDRQGVPWLQTPYYDRQGRLTGVQNRNLIRGASPRFRFPSGSQCGIYNLPVLNLLKPGEALYITEGCSDCWAMLSAGHKAIAIPSATLLTRNDVEQLSALRDQSEVEFHMYPDRDEPGERLFLQLQRVLPSLVHHQLPQGCKDYSDYYLASHAEQAARR